MPSDDRKGLDYVESGEDGAIRLFGETSLESWNESLGESCWAAKAATIQALKFLPHIKPPGFQSG
jgi:hypothetical protein